MKRFDDVSAFHNDDVQIAFTVRDRNDTLVDLTGATATFRVALKDSLDSLLELTEADGITFASSVATVAFNTGDIQTVDFERLCIYRFVGQLRITKNGKAMVAAEGEIIIGPLIE